MNQTNCVFAFCFLFLCLSISATAKNPVVEQQPSWATATVVNYAANKLDQEAEDGYAELQFEKQVSLQQQAVYSKRAVHILSEAGVQNQSQVSVDYDPSYQSLAFHSIRIIRGSEIINKLDLSKIKTIQQEKELNRFLYNGSLTAVLILDDVRKGDIIEYSYTIKGFNPIFKNKFSEQLQTKFGVPIYQIYYKLIVPNGRNLNIKNSLTDIQPSITSNNDEKTFEWKISDAAAVHTEANIPSWHDAFPMVMISEFNSWKEVADWASELFPFSASLPGVLQQKIAEIKAKSPTTEAQLLSALRFVQDDVRYMGIEMGQHSHKPHSPTQIFTQRFGDCKDKAYLLCTLLHGLGIETYPVLINTGYKKTIAAWQPAATAFDHTTVCVQLKGKTYWFDPTISFQRGPLEAISYPDYQVGLLVRPGTTGLTNISLQDKGKVDTKEAFVARRLYGPASLIVTTNFSGSFADNVRYSFQNNGFAEMKKSYKEFYASYFKKLEMDSLTYTDNEETGVFTTTEYYTVKDFWSYEANKTKVLIEPFLINSIIKKPKEAERTMPYSLLYPVRYHEEVEVDLPDDWSIDANAESFRDEAFSFNYRFSLPSSHRVLLEYNYENLADHVKPEETAHYLKTINSADAATTFELSSTVEKTTSSPFSTASGSGFTTAYILLGICAFVTYLYKKRNRTGNRWG